MQLKKITLLISKILFISTLSHSVNSCEEKNFWQTWYKDNQFKGFGIVPNKKDIAQAQYLFAENHYEGKKLSKDYSRALDLYTKASDSGVNQANFKLGLMNHYGKGKVKNLKLAYEYYIKSANNNPESQFNLGLMNRYGIGTKKDLKNAFYWFSQAAQKQIIYDSNNCRKSISS